MERNTVCQDQGRAVRRAPRPGPPWPREAQGGRAALLSERSQLLRLILHEDSLGFLLTGHSQAVLKLNYLESLTLQKQFSSSLRWGRHK